MKQNLDYRRLADHLTDRDLVDAATIQHVQHQCASTGALLTEILVRENLVSDWEISRICAELFNLPFLPVDTYPPSSEALEGLNPDYLRQYGLVPLDRFGEVLTLSMPGIVPVEVLEVMREEYNVKILPVIGSVKTNREWLEEHLPSGDAVSLEQFSAALPEDDSSWANIFDEGDEAVQAGLQELVADDTVQAGLQELVADDTVQAGLQELVDVDEED